MYLRDVASMPWILHLGAISTKMIKYDMYGCVRGADADLQPTVLKAPTVWEASIPIQQCQ